MLASTTISRILRDTGLRKITTEGKIQRNHIMANPRIGADRSTTYTIEGIQ
ncbi:hypothetical protein BH18THE2_BH18THE2_30830 [soil metagenome]